MTELAVCAFGIAPSNATQKTQQCVSNFYNSAVGKAVQFGSPLSLLPVWNPQWGDNLAEWGVAIVGKLGGLFGSGATPGTNQLTTLSGTKIVGSAPRVAQVSHLRPGFMWDLSAADDEAISALPRVAGA
jgi:hypothetical protein